MKGFILLSIVIYCVQADTTKVVYGYEDESGNLVNNWSFEEPLNKKTDWGTRKAEYEVVTDSTTAHTGSKYVRIYNRKPRGRDAGLVAYFKNLKANNLYYMSVFIKLFDSKGDSLFYDVRLSGYDMATRKRVPVAKFKKVRGNGMWRQLGGDFVLQDDIASMRFGLDVGDRKVEYHLDTVSLINIPLKDNWEDICSQDVKKFRQNDIKISMPLSMEPKCKIRVRLEQRSRHFKIGSGVSAIPFMLQTQLGEDYRNFFFKHFEAGTFINALKWAPMEPNKGEVDFNATDSVISLMKAKKLPVFGNAVLWSLMEGNPEWVQHLRGKDLLDAANSRIDYTMEHYQNKINNWIVLNEYNHGRLFTNRIPNPRFADYAYKRANGKNPTAGLYINDYQAISQGVMTSALADIAVDLLSRNVPLHGIGMQGHVRKLPIKPEQFLKRFEILTAAGLPLMITEASVHTTDVAERAEQLNVFLQTAMCSPNVAGIFFWAFSNHTEEGEKISFEPETWSMFDGPGFVANKAGDVFLKLMERWNSSAWIDFDGQEKTHTIRAYHGDYVAKVYMNYNGADTYIKEKSFTLDPGQDSQISIPLTWDEIGGKFQNTDISGCKTQ